MKRLALLVLAVGTVAAGCGGDDDRPPRWSYISPAIIQPSCATASCHSEAAHQAGVRLDTRASGYDSLTSSGYPDKRFFVVKGDPQRSELLYLLRAEGIRRMPRDAPLPDADIALVERWIVAGAGND